MPGGKFPTATPQTTKSNPTARIPEATNIIKVKTSDAECETSPHSCDSVSGRLLM